MARRLGDILEGLFGAGSEAAPSEPERRRCPACDSLLYEEEGGRLGVLRCLGCDALWRWSGRRGEWERVKR